MKDKKYYRSPDFAKYVVTYLLDLKEEAAQAKEEKLALQKMLKSGDLTKDEKSELKISFVQAKILHKALKAVYRKAKEELGYYTDGGNESEDFDMEDFRAMFQSFPEKEAFLPEQDKETQQTEKRARKPAEKPVASLNSSGPAKRGPKPAVKNADKVEVPVTSTNKRGRKPAIKSKQDTDMALPVASSTKRGRKPAKLSTANTEILLKPAAKRGRKPVVTSKQDADMTLRVASSTKRGRKPAELSTESAEILLKQAAKRGRKAAVIPTAESKPAMKVRGRKPAPKPLAPARPATQAKRGPKPKNK